jgi:putative membrane protein
MPRWLRSISASARFITVFPQIPYCGAVPLPGTLFDRFNLDPKLILVLIAVAGCQWWMAAESSRRKYGLAGWLLASVAFLSPLCALSVALFSARVAQHMILVLIAAPLIALGLPRSRAATSWPLWLATVIFSLALWFWHMPAPYEATFVSIRIYWSMHVTLFGSAVYLWRELLEHPRERTVGVLAAGAVTFVQMGLLGAVFAFADHAMFAWHLTTTQVWGFSPLADQQLGGVFMWVPGTALFLWAAIRSLARLWRSMEKARPA